MSSADELRCSKHIVDEHDARWRRRRECRAFDDKCLTGGTGGKAGRSEARNCQRGRRSVVIRDRQFLVVDDQSLRICRARQIIEPSGEDPTRCSIRGDRHIRALAIEAVGRARRQGQSRGAGRGGIGHRRELRCEIGGKRLICGGGCDGMR